MGFRTKKIKQEMKRSINKKAKKFVLAFWNEAVDQMDKTGAVDTGTARFNWNASMGEIDDSTVEKPSPPTPNFYGRPKEPDISGDVTRGDEGWVTNFTPYIRIINDGRGPAPPFNFIENAMNNFRAKVQSGKINI